MNTVRLMVAGIVAASLAGCGADEIVSPGSGGNITINNPPANPPGNGGGDPGDDLVEPASGCPTIANNPGLRDDGTITGPTGTYRVCALPARFTTSTALQRFPGLLYALDGRVDVGCDLGAGAATLPGGSACLNTTPVTLSIQPGVVIFAKTGTSWLVVNRHNRINAVGETTRPIVFTSRDNVQGLAGDDSQGQWGGVVLLGRAPITDCAAAGATPGTEQCERQTEGAVDPALFGGATANDNSGTLRYVQIRYSGYVLSGNSELQSLTLGGVGSGTQISHIQSHNSSDDGFENFGGTVPLRRFVITGADDDSIDVDTGYRGTIQHVIAVQKTTGAADSMIELDSPGANSTTAENQVPRTWLKLANFTFVHRNPASGNGAAMRFRGGADASLVNGIVISPMAALRMDNTNGGVNILGTDGAVDKVGPPSFLSVVLQSGAASPFSGSGGTPALTAGDVAAAFNAGTNNNVAFVTSLTGGFVNGANETAVVATNPATVDAAFDATDYVGAVPIGGDAWYAGWTCNSATATFGSASGSCTSIPALD
ncbi:MAG TPA: hypothetical protein VNQ32_00680 [Steroidobacteraceae bacterium]|nr:hypothetical protein [Steroidobacteraceae bacterium]